MNFSLTDDQTMLKDSVSRFIDTAYDFETRQKNAGMDARRSESMWQTFAELGWTAVLFAEADGGLDGGPVELALLMEQFGRGLVIEPFLANVVLAGGVLKRVASEAQKSAWLTPMITGERQLAFGYLEPQSRFDIANVALTATRDGDSYLLNGSKALVFNGDAAQTIIISARTSGAQTDHDGISLLAIDAETPGISRRPYQTVDAHRAAEVEFVDARIDKDQLLGQAGGAFGTLQQVIDEATLAVSSEAIGIMQTMHAKTVEYSKSRVQFGVPVGSFQALQHRMVDMMIACEQSRSLLYWCLMLAADEDLQKAVSALKYQVGTAGIHIAREAVQLHGGMGVTWELDIAHYFKRISAIDVLFGNSDYHLDRFASLSA